MSITLAQLVKDGRVRLCLAQGKVGKLSGINLSEVVAIEAGQSGQLSPEAIAGLARALKVAEEDVQAAIAGTLDCLPWERVTFPTYWGVPRKTDGGFNQPFQPVKRDAQ
ncbi:MAG: helix-turn-helix domain-containing protein [Chloroflexi bacterium]|nr:helix-turn-helix domain-containing protein [Chloroflexota bacterium]